ncbi:MAG: DUF11 domain-containing protein [Ardenticatenaceae bacterium]|nr:DUF11 domain-containing protein [Ardenticatenaceae bacterium]
MKKWVLIFTFLVAVLWLVNGDDGRETAVAQSIASAIPLVENFSNGQSPPQFNTAEFNHDLLITDIGWLLGPLSPGQPLSPSPQSALTLYANNVDRITFNQPTPSATIAEAQVWAWAWPAEEGNPATSGRVVFEGTQDTKTFTFSGGMSQWQAFKVNDTDTGDNGRTLGAIIAVRLISLQADVMFDDLQVVSVTTFSRSDLALTMSGSKSTVNVGDTISYDLTVTNNGPDDAPNVTLTDTLPFGGTFLAGSSSTACQLSLGQVVCDLGTVAANASRTVTIVVRVGSDACASFTNQATVTTQAYDSNTANDTAVHTATTPNPACADYAIELTAHPIPVDPEEDFTYSLTVRNNGPDTAGATIAATIPIEIFPLDVVPDTGVTCTGTRQLSCTVASLAPGQQAQVFVTARLSLVATGLLETTASVTPTINDPQTENNVTRFRFTGGTPYTYTLIAEAGVGALANFDDIHGVAMNENGEVAFWASHERGVQDSLVVYDDWAAFVGDGTTTTRRFGLADLSPVPAPLEQVWGSCPDINDAGWLAAETYVFDPTAVFHNTTQNALYLIDPNGVPVQLAAASVEDDGAAFQRYHNPVLNNANSVLSAYSTSTSAKPATLIQFDNGQQTELYHTNNEIDDIGINDQGQYAFVETILLNNQFLYSYRLWIGSGAFKQDILQYDTHPWASFLSDGITLNNNGQVVYSQLHRDPGTDLMYESFYRNSLPLFTRQSTAFTTESAPRIIQTGINDKWRYAYYGSISATDNQKLGIFTGPHYLANRVVAFSSTVWSGWGTPMFGSTAHTYNNHCTTPINNAGQIAFSATLDNGRIVVVRADPVRDNDGDGITDWDELGAPNNGDGNGDGIPDSVQPEITSASSLDGAYQVTFAVNPNQTLVNVTPIANPSPGDAPNQRFPLGYFSFEVHDLNPGAAAEVDIYLPSWMVLNGWWKYGRTPDNPTPHWYNFTFDGTTGAEINGNIITLHFVDGQRGDDDLTANGIIVDPGAPSTWANSVYLPAVMR